MHTSEGNRAARCAVAAAIFLAGCSGAGSSIGARGNGSPILAAPQSGQDRFLKFVDPSAVKVGVYVGLNNVNLVYEYPQYDKKNHPPYCTLSGSAMVGVVSIGVDKARALWVPSQNFGAIDPNAYPITSYAPNCRTPGITLEDPHGDPTGIAFDSRGTNYVMEAFTLANGNVGAIAVFPKGHKSPSRFLSTLINGICVAIGVDSKDNVYVMYFGSANTGTVVEFKKGMEPGVTLGVTTPYIPGGTLVFDKSDNMLVNYNNVTSYLEIYAPPYSGTPTVFPLKGGSHQCALNQLETSLACADYGNNSVDIFSYPSVSYRFSVTAGIPPNAGVAGLAYDPAAPN